MHCPECGCRTDVYDSRLNTRGLVRRRRSCPKCGFRFATIEVMNEYQPLGKKEKADAPIPEAPPQVVKVRSPKAAKVIAPRVRQTVRREKPRSLEEDVVPFDYEPAEDLSTYIDIPRGFDD